MSRPIHLSVMIVTFCLSTQTIASHLNGFDNESEVRVARKVVKTVGKLKDRGPHPLDAAIEMAYNGLERMKTIRDYEAQLIRRERINGKLTGYQYCDVKIRNAHDEKNVPFSIYMRFKKPVSVDGREAIWVQGKNQNKIIAHEAGAILGKITVYLNPDGPIAMKDNRHPIYEAGFKVLVERLIEKASAERAYGECEVEIKTGQTFAKRSCTVIEVVHPEPRDYFEFHKALIYIDDELQLPVRYEAYSWPKEKGGKPLLMEQYVWTKIKLNVGLKDIDFDPRNENYNYCLLDPPLVKKEELKVAESSMEE